MRLCSIASGSSGNCIYVGSDRTHLLVDTGISKKRIEEGLKELEIKGKELDGILITHEHADHIQGLGVFSRKYEIPIYGTPGTIRGIRDYKNLGKMPEGLYHEIQVDKEFKLGDMKISYDARRVTIGEEEIRLTQTEYNIVELLAVHAGKVLTYAEIIKKVWGYSDSGSVKKLQVNMANIRKKFGETPGEYRYIRNELGVGYRMNDEQEV